MVYRVRTLNAISPIGLERFPADRYEVAPDLPDPQAIVLRSANLHGQPIPASLLAVARAGAGTNNIPIPEYSAQGIAVFNTPGSNANAVKELVIAALFLAARNIIPAAAFAHRLDGDAAAMAKAVEAGKKQFAGFELPGKTLGVIGLGAIGVEVANAASGLGMRVVGFDPAITVEHAWKLSPLVERVASLDELLRRSDIVTIHVPLVDSTRNLIGAEQLAAMRSSAVLINFARGPVVEEAALVAALEERSLHGYVCDFPTPNLNKRDHVVTLPHLGASTDQAEVNSAVMAVDQVRDYLESGAIRNSVNLPPANLARVEGTHRLAIVNQNVPGLVGRISTLVAEAGLNIADLLNKSREDLAYTLVDVDGQLPAALLDRARAIDGVISARLIDPI
ncbi:MAG: phosphoglycerate dehydrogenase [Bifidobacteriaceae bacterium]|jgi:D-3-phosphoglycerate dehydrogenase|nr:phosphoglycerate dehydrogenase [Bifidobacteriaceae bacterium]